MSEKTFVVDESLLRAALADAEARIAAANVEIGHLDEAGYNDSGRMREAMMVVEYGQQHITRLKKLLSRELPGV